MSEISIKHDTGNTVKQSQAILDRYVVFLKSNEYDSVGSERFGANLADFIDDQKNEDTYIQIRNRILSKTQKNFPDVQIRKIVFRQTSNKTVQINLDVLIVPTGDSVTAIIEA